MEWRDYEMSVIDKFCCVGDEETLYGVTLRIVDERVAVPKPIVTRQISPTTYDALKKNSVINVRMYCPQPDKLNKQLGRDWYFSVDDAWLKREDGVGIIIV